MADLITSVQNPRVKALRALREPRTRKKAGLFLIEGEKMLGEARAAGLAVREVLYDPERVSPEAAGSGAQPAAAHVIAALCDTVTPQGTVAAVEPPAAPTLDELCAARRRGTLLFTLLDGVQDPGNVGTIWRTCDAAAFDALILSPDCPDEYSPKVIRASMGAVFRVPTLRMDLLAAIDSLRRAGCAIVSSQLDGAPLRAGLPRGDIALVIGNEARGVSPQVRAQATHTLRLPMPGGAESLNAAVAAGIMMYACIDGRRSES